MKILLIIFFYSISTNLFADIRIAILDTGFCPEKIKLKENIHLENVIDLTNSVKQDYCKKFNPSLPRFHGHLVLQSFVNFIVNSTEKIIITPYVIFDYKGQQEKKYWQQTLTRQYDLFISAAGLVTEEKFSNSLIGEWFVAAPRIGPGIKIDSVVFPVSLAPLNNLFVIGDFIEGDPKLFDKEQLYKDKINYFFSSGTGDLRGTSRAVAEAAARAIIFCANQLKIKNNLRECLKKKSIDVSGDISGMKSF